MNRGHMTTPPAGTATEAGAACAVFHLYTGDKSQRQSDRDGGSGKELMIQMHV